VMSVDPFEANFGFADSKRSAGVNAARPGFLEGAVLGPVRKANGAGDDPAPQTKSLARR
jgi:hypothetical protein